MVIKVTSPNARASTLIDDAFCKALKNIKPSANRPKMDYEVVKVTTAAVGQIRLSPIREGELRRTYETISNAHKAALGEIENMRAVTARGAGPGNAAAKATDADAPFKDRLVPDEDVRDDWDFTVVMFVKLDPKAYEAPAPAQPGPQALGN